MISVLMFVPVLTMRLFSEEHRTGTLEMMLTAPVEETVVVLSKFLAALILFLIVWLPWGLYLVSLRCVGGSAFDYRRWWASRSPCWSAGRPSSAWACSSPA